MSSAPRSPVRLFRRGRAPRRSGAHLPVLSGCAAARPCGPVRVLRFWSFRAARAVFLPSCGGPVPASGLPSLPGLLLEPVPEVLPKFFHVLCDGPVRERPGEGPGSRGGKDCAPLRLRRGEPAASREGGRCPSGRQACGRRPYQGHRVGCQGAGPCAGSGAEFDRSVRFAPICWRFLHLFSFLLPEWLCTKNVFIVSIWPGLLRYRHVCLSISPGSRSFPVRAGTRSACRAARRVPAVRFLFPSHVSGRPWL